eukprot:157792_1
MTFKTKQKQFLVNLMENQTLCDATISVGQEKQEMYAVRALLANISPVFKAQLFGEFKESQVSESISFPTIEPNIFKCIILTSMGLDPEVDSLDVLALIKAADMLQIDFLKDECINNRINKDNVLHILHEAYRTNYLNIRLYKQCMSVITKNSTQIISESNDAFLSIHPYLLEHILQCDFFHAKEEDIWNACLNWAKTIHNKKLQF